jgi:hypothetical protein
MPKLHFLNVDLDLLFADEPKLLLSELGRKVVVLHSEQQSNGCGWYTCLELNRVPKTPEQAIRRWIEVLNKLSPKARREFLKATSRTFDLGFDVGNDRTFHQIKLPSDLLTKLARWRAGYTITLYQEEADPKVESGAPRPGPTVSH